MTTEEKAKAYDEALEKARAYFENENYTEMADVFPELKESEDERIRKEIISIVKEYGRICEKEGDPCHVINDCLAYLEKQKEQKPVQSDEEREYVRVLKSLISDFIRENYKSTDISFYQKIYDWLDGRHIEQKPVECGCTNDESEYDRGYRDGHRFGLQQTEDYMIGKTFKGLIPCWVNAPSELQPAHKYHGKNAVIMHENNGGFRCVCIDDEKPVTFHLPEDTLFVEGWRKKPSEWSEEDEETRKDIIAGLEATKRMLYRADASGQACYNRWIDWLKSLRNCPKASGTWKPSEEQMMALEKAIIKAHSTYEIPILTELRQQLKKLM